jgi:two-component system LytT family sensor kinase
MNIKKTIEPIIHILLWLGGYILFVFTVQTLGVFKADDKSLFLPVTFGTLINIALFYITALKVIPDYSKTKRGLRFLAQTAGVYIGFTLLETLFDYFLFMNIYSGAAVDQEFYSQFIINSIFNLFILAAALAYGFIKVYVRNEKQRQQLKSEKLTAELDFLKAQVNPHFLFNVLNMAYSSASSHGDERTADIIEKLANLMRYMLYESNVAKVELEKEINYLESFIHLQKNRLSTEVQPQIDFIIKGAITGYQIAPLLLIPFVENAFKHGIRIGEVSPIHIKLEVKGNTLFFIVENTVGKGKANNLAEVGGIGLKNVKKRLILLYPNAHKLSITENNRMHRVELTLDLNP